MKPNKGEEYDVKKVPFITDIPINTIKLEIICTVMDGEETFDVSCKMDTSDVREGMISGEEYDFNNTVYKLSDEYLNEMNN